MSIFSRMADIVNANLTALLDRAEDPEKMIRLMIQEMEDTLVEVRTSAARGIADKKEATRKLRRIEKATADWQRKAELALSKGRDDLAKAALIEKTKLGDVAAGLNEELARLNEELAKQEADAARLDVKLREVKAKQQAVAARQRSASTRTKVRRSVHDSRIDEALARFEQMERRLDETEAHAESYDIVRGKSLSEEIRDLEADGAVEQELAALKRRIRPEEQA